MTTLSTSTPPRSDLRHATTARRRRWRQLRRSLIGLLVTLLLLAVAGSIYQTVATGRERRALPPPGQLVAIGDTANAPRLHLHCVGVGSPTVILESGQGGLSADWVWIQTAVAAVTQVCAYDRAGVGWSDPGPAPRDAQQITEELHQLLRRAGLAAPYLLVGHSYGGLYVRLYAATYPDEVAGLVLVDASHPDQWQRLPGAEAQFRRIGQIYRIGAVLTRLGLLRLSNYNPLLTDLPPQQATEHKAMADSAAFVDTAAAEFAASPATSDQVGAAGRLGDKPLFVLSATEHDAPPEVEAMAQAFQRELAALSTNHVHQIIRGATHASLLLKQEDAQVTSAAILAVVAAVREEKPLDTVR
ncbi:MAG: alpha/beta hydrolase [Caldilinea sp. CFX5]|nr:alpha/beta hydrolase [Caldilinea sp. CFX5]